MYRKYLDDKNYYLKAQEFYRKLVNKKQAMFERTQPGAVKYDGEKVDGGLHINNWDDYIDKTQDLDDQIIVAHEIVKARKMILDLSEQDLRNSSNVLDMVFVARYLDRKKVFQISAIVNYSERQVKRFLRTIREYKIKD